MEKQAVSRNYSIDNLKAVVMMCVVLIHVALCLDHERILSVTHQFMLIFTMPCFVFLSGYLAKGVVKNGHFHWNRVFSMLWMYVFFKLIWFVVEYICKGEAKLDFLTVASAPWYLLALAIWYLMIPLLTAFPKKYVIIATIIIGIFSGYINVFSTFLSLSRVLVYLPFFTVGLLLEKEQMETFTRRNLRFPALIILCVLVIIFALLFDKIWFFASLYYGEYPYEQVMNEALIPYGGVVRAIVFILASIISICLLAIVPKEKVFFSYVGKNTLAVYILHALIRNVLVYMGVFDWINETYSQQQMLWAVPVVVVVTLFLGNPLFGKMFTFILNPLPFFKRFAVIGILAVLFLTGCVMNGSKEYPETVTKIACVGDSITFRHGFDEEPENNYPTVLAELLGENYEVVNFGESGTCVQTDGDCAYVDQSVYQDGLDYNADILIFMLGTNDSKEWNWKGEEAFRKSYENLLDQYVQKENSPKILIGISPKAFYINGKTSGTAEFGIEPVNVEKIVEIQRQVAQERGYTVIDIYELTSQHPEWLEEDGIHPTLEGARGIALAVAEAIQNEEKE